MRLILLSLICSLLAAGEAPLPPKVDAAYRAYLAALAKTYQAETAKLEATLKKEATANKKDATAAAAIEALQAKLARHEHLDDFAGLVKGDALDAGKIAGGADQLIGTWLETMNGVGMTGTVEVTIQPKGRAMVKQTWNASVTEAEAAWEIVTREGAQVFVLYRSKARDASQLNRGAFAVQEISLPLPAGATTVQVTYKSEAISANGQVLRSQDQRTWTPKPAEKPVQKMVR